MFASFRFIVLVRVLVCVILLVVDVVVVIVAADVAEVVVVVVAAAVVVVGGGGSRPCRGLPFGCILQFYWWVVGRRYQYHNRLWISKQYEQWYK